MIKPTLTYFFDTRRQLSDGKFPLKLTVYYAGQKKRYKTPFKTSSDGFDKLFAENVRSEAFKLFKRVTTRWMYEQTQMAEAINPFSFAEFE